MEHQKHQEQSLCVEDIRNKLPVFFSYDTVKIFERAAHTVSSSNIDYVEVANEIIKNSLCPFRCGKKTYYDPDELIIWSSLYRDLPTEKELSDAQEVADFKKSFEFQKFTNALTPSALSECYTLLSEKIKTYLEIHGMKENNPEIPTRDAQGLLLKAATYLDNIVNDKRPNVLEQLLIEKAFQVFKDAFNKEEEVPVRVLMWHAFFTRNVDYFKNNGFEIGDLTTNINVENAKKRFFEFFNAHSNYYEKSSAAFLRDTMVYMVNITKNS